MSFTKTLILLVSLLFISGLQIANADVSDVRYRSIIYFYPDAKKISKNDLSKHLDGFTKVDKLPEAASKAFVVFSIIRDFRDSYPVPDNRYLSFFGRGVDKKQAVSIQKSKLALIVDIAYPIQMSFKGIKLVSEFLHKIASSYGGLIWDSETRELFGPDMWKEKRIDSWGDTIPDAENHTVIHAYKTDDGVRGITLGMAKFGLPDIVINNFSWSLNRQMGNLINLVAQSIIEGNRLTENGTIKLNIDKLKNTAYKRKLITTLKDNAVSELEIEIGEGKWEEGDPNNYLIELLFESAQGKSLSEKQQKVVSALFGWEDSIVYVNHNELILEASKRAKEKLNDLRKDFNSGLAPGEFIQVKAPFDTPDGGVEWMWVEVMSWKEKDIRGLLKNEPFNIPDLKAGSEVAVDQNKVFDYIRNHPNGTSEGNETGALIRKYQQ